MTAAAEAAADAGTDAELMQPGQCLLADWRSLTELRLAPAACGAAVCHMTLTWCMITMAGARGAAIWDKARLSPEWAEMPYLSIHQHADRLHRRPVSGSKPLWNAICSPIVRGPWVRMTSSPIFINYPLYMLALYSSPHNSADS